MAPRTSARLLTSSSSTPAPTTQVLQPTAQSVSTVPPQLLELRRQWKWAALSQFFYTFASLIALEDVTLADVENDLVDSSMKAIPRLMQRLLITLSNDRKITVDNWQSALRRQYLRRDPAANPIGVEPVAPKQSRSTTVTSEVEDRSNGLDRKHVKPIEGTEGVEEENKDETVANVGRHNSNRDGSVENAEGSVRNLSAKPEKVDETYDSVDVEDEPRDWMDLPMLDKLESMHTVVEWHFQNPLKLRQIMRSDDEDASWRIEPIGFDAKRNSYWLIGHRLWIQREFPKRPTKSTKRKAQNAASSRKTKVPRLSKAISMVQIEQASPSNRSTPSRNNTGNRLSNGAKHARNPRRSDANDANSSVPGSLSRARAAKTQANAKLDLQAKQLAAAKAEFESLNRRSSRGSASRPLGTRLSRRLRGEDDDDDWQQIPPEWLEDNDKLPSSPTKRLKRSATKASTSITTTEVPLKPEPITNRGKSEEHAMDNFTGLDSDNESDLTELSDSETSSRKGENQEENEVPPSDILNHEDNLENLGPWPPADFVEWETICVSLAEWESIASQFEKATYHLEKRLFKKLSQEIVPYVTEILKESERQRRKEEALMNRKRSSRLAIRESEKELARETAARQAEEEEKMARIRRLEIRTRREEDERAKREDERERRRREREERELVRSQRLEKLARGEVEDTQGEEEKFNIATDGEEVGSGIEEKGRSKGKTRDMGASKRSNSLGKTINARDKQPSKAPRRQSKKDTNQKASGEDWELDCELCGAKGKNRDGGVPLMSCGKCGKWQHISCHDAADERACRQRRNWDIVDFFCIRCRGSEQSTTTQNNSHWQYGQSYPTLHPSSMASSYLSSSGLVPKSSNGFAQMTEPRLAVNGQKTPMNYMPYAHRSVTSDSQFRNDIVPVASPIIPPVRQHNSVTFAHYQPLQRGFAPHPTAHQSQDPFHTYGQSHTAYPLQSSIRDQKGGPTSTASYYHQPTTSNGTSLPQHPPHPSSQQYAQQNLHQTLTSQFKPSTPSGSQPYYTS